MKVALPLALLLGVGPLPAPPAPARNQTPPAAAALPGSPVAEAEALERKLEALARRSAKGRAPREKRTTVGESELNSYVSVTLGPKIPKGVSDVKVRFEQDRLAARALVDLAQFQDKVPQGSLGLLSFLSGPVPLTARARLVQAEDGFGALALEEVTLSTFPVPLTLVEQLVASATRSSTSPEGFDVNSPFRLPYGLKRIKLQPGQALLEY